MGESATSGVSQQIRTDIGSILSTARVSGGPGTAVTVHMP